MRTQSSRGAGTGRVRWTAPGCETVELRRSVLEGIDTEAEQGLNAVPRRGAEVGGLLLGSRCDGEVTVEDFEPIPCEHRFGPSYQLSKIDLQGLEETLLWVRQQARPELAVVGFYRSHTREEFGLSFEDHRFFSTYFAGPGNLFLLVRPSRLNVTVADFFVWRNGQLEEAYHPVPFPFQGEEGQEPPRSPAPRPARAIEPEPPRAVEPERARAIATPAPVPPSLLIDEPERRPRRSWGFALVAIFAVAGFVGYDYLAHPPDEPPPPAPITRLPMTVPAPIEARPAPPPAAPAAAPEPAAVRPEPAPVRLEPAPVRLEPAPAPVKREPVRDVLTRWAETIQRGDMEGMSRFYLPALVPDARWRLHRALARYGPLAVNRISHVDIVPLGRDGALATFRRHWESGPARKIARETEERLHLVHTREGWRIASERQIRVFWTYGGG